MERCRVPVAHLIAVITIAPGTGVVAARPSGVLYSPDGMTSVVDVFRSAAPTSAGCDEVSAIAAAARSSAEPFVLIVWEHDVVRLAVSGTVELRTNSDSARVLTGADAPTGATKQMTIADAPLRLWAGSPVLAGTYLPAGGVVPAGGVDVVVSPDGPAGARRVGSGGRREQADVTADVRGAATGALSDRLAALHAAAGGDWMNATLGLGGTPRSHASTSPELAQSSELSAAPTTSTDDTLPTRHPLPPPPVGTGTWAPSPSGHTSGPIDDDGEVTVAGRGAGDLG